MTVVTGLDTPREGQFEAREIQIQHGDIRLSGYVPTYDVEVVELLRIRGGGWTFTGSAGQIDAAATLQTQVDAGEAISLSQTARVATSLEQADPLSLVCSTGADGRLREDHEAAWNRLWATDIEIEGDPPSQLFARAALYYLWSTILENDRWSIAPMGLSGNGYNGHIFWDAEMWMFPALLVTHPGMARSCVAYREFSLPAARERAAARGFRGAQFPWEGASTGSEMTPAWAETGDFQLHITADVALAQWWYFINTQDLDWLREHGFPVIRACADFWSSRVEHNDALDRYEIHDVVCADEYAEHVDNDAYTNAAVMQALLIADRAAELVKEEAPAEWRHIASRMHVPYDKQARTHLEFDGYDGRVTKQADVELLVYPLQFVTDPEQIVRDLDFYAKVIDPNGPAMSFSVYSIVSAQLGRVEEAYEYFRRSYIPNTRPPFYAFSETPTNNAFFFCTGVGGSLQALLFGFTGLRLGEQQAVLKPALPRQWKKLTLRNLFILGCRTDVEISSDTVVVRRVYPDGTKHTSIHAMGEVVVLDAIHTAAPPDRIFPPRVLAADG
jgi:trehalose/maltose hydrolase-like predicted phosphorylase